MLRSWTYKLIEKKFYCAECSAISTYSIYSREPFSVHAGVPFGIPLVCRCKLCETFFVAFSQELYFGKPSFNAEYAKLLSQNRIAPNDWVYVDGKTRPGCVAGHYSTRTEEVVELDFGHGEREKFTRPLMTHFNERAPLGFKLLPAQAGVALLGDPIYHVLRQMTGFVVGRVSDHGAEKLVVQLENGKIIFMTLPDEYQLLPDRVLLEHLTECVKTYFSSIVETVKLNVVHSVVYVYGSVPELPLKEEVIREIKKLPDIRGVVDLLSVRIPGDPIPDDELWRAVLRILEDHDSPFFNCEIQVRDGILKLNAYYTSGSDFRTTIARLRHIQGLRDAQFEIEEVGAPPPHMRHVADMLRVKMKLDKKAKMDQRLRIIPMADGVLVEGSVKSMLQKSLLNIFIARAAKGVRVDTRIRIDNSLGEI